MRVCVCVCVFTVESGCLQITSHPFNMVLLLTGLLCVWPWEWHVQADICSPETHSDSQGAPLKMGRMRCSPSPQHKGISKMYAGFGGRGRVCVKGGGGGSLCVCSLLNQAPLQITSHPFNRVALPTGLLSVWPWEWHVEAANFCWPETHSQSQGPSLKMSRMRCSPSPHHNGTSKMHAGLCGKGCVCLCVCSLWNQALCKSRLILLTWWFYQQDF